MKLWNCLLQQTWRTLRAIAKARKLPFDDHLPKQDSASQLAQHLVEPDDLRQALNNLSPEAQAALHALIEAEGQMRREVFTSRFGSIRPYKPWRNDAPQAPWENPASPAEELAYRGLVFVVNQGTKKRPVWAVVLPDEIKTALPSPTPALRAPPPSPKALGEGGGWGEGEGDISTAILTFLCFLNGEDIRPLHGRWLPPNACHTLASHLSAISYQRSERTPTASSELCPLPGRKGGPR